MSIPDSVFDKYFTFEARVASFQKSQTVHKNPRASTTVRGPRTMKWPHKFISAEELADAGFFYYPFQSQPDNVCCFLCKNAMHGWEEGDDALTEHLGLAPNCGWAIVTAVGCSHEDYATRDPTSDMMISARKATFADRWPHEYSEGWKCKTKKLAEAGWKYTPVSDSDDFTTCVYCNLGLDGWDAEDDPMVEHLKRAPACPYFLLFKEFNGEPKPVKGKAGSQAATEATAAEFVPMLEATADDDDTAMTSTSTASTATTVIRKVARKKAAPASTTTKGRKPRIKKNESATTDNTSMSECEDPTEKPAPKKRAASGKAVNTSRPDAGTTTTTAQSRGKKRPSEAVNDEEEEEPEEEGPPAKKRSTRGASKTVKQEAALATRKPPVRKGRVASGAKKPAAAPRKAPVAADNPPAVVNNTDQSVEDESAVPTVSQICPAAPKLAIPVPVSPAKPLPALSTIIETPTPPQPHNAQDHTLHLTSTASNDLLSESHQPLIASAMKEPVLSSPLQSDGDGNGTQNSFKTASKMQSPSSLHSPHLSDLECHVLSTSTPSPPSRHSKAENQPPQSPDAENHSPRPNLDGCGIAIGLAGLGKKPDLAPTVPPKTPAHIRMSPARRNLFGGLQSTVPWSPIDLDAVFGSARGFCDRADAFFDPPALLRTQKQLRFRLDGGGGGGADEHDEEEHDDNDDDGAVDGGLATGDNAQHHQLLPADELAMSVEDWVLHRAARAEEFVRDECEAMVAAFEQKGQQALRAVDGLVCVEEGGEL